MVNGYWVFFFSFLSFFNFGLMQQKGVITIPLRDTGTSSREGGVEGQCEGRVGWSGRPGCCDTLRPSGRERDKGCVGCVLNLPTMSTRHGTGLLR
jgi:hypothetical protein